MCGKKKIWFFNQLLATHCNTVNTRWLQPERLPPLGKEWRTGAFSRDVCPKHTSLEKQPGSGGHLVGRSQIFQVFTSEIIRRITRENTSPVSEQDDCCAARVFTWDSAGHKHPKCGSQSKTQVDWQILAVFFKAGGHLGNGATSKKLQWCELGSAKQGKKKKKI